jgi:hypothetical protein
MRDTELLEEINANIKKLLGVIATQGLNDEKKILTLQRMGYNSREIHEMTGMDEGNIRKKWKSKTKK